jgi:hypothetical protein
VYIACTELDFEDGFVRRIQGMQAEADDAAKERVRELEKEVRILKVQMLRKKKEKEREKEVGRVDSVVTSAARVENTDEKGHGMFPRISM